MDRMNNILNLSLFLPEPKIKPLS